MRPGTLGLVLSVLCCVRQHVADVRLARLRRRIDMVVGEHDGEEDGEHQGGGQ